METKDVLAAMAADRGVLALGAHDQLSKSIASGRAFKGFEEAPIKFNPTYKYVVGSHECDTSRCPAYCDRVLWRVAPTSKVAGLRYDAIDRAVMSDHRPVSALLQWVLPIPS